MRRSTNLRLQNRRHKRIKKLKVILVLFVMASMVVTTVLTSKFLYQKIAPQIKKSSIFHLKHVVAHSSEHVAEAELLNSAKPFYGKNIFEIDLDQLTKKIKRNPWILNASISRIVPDRIRIQVIEKTPFAILSMQKLYFLDLNGRIISEIRPNENMNFPVISGVSPSDYKKRAIVQRAFKLIQKYNKNTYLKDWPLSEIHWKKKNGFILYTSNPSFEIRVGKNDFLDKYERLEKVLKDLSQKSLIPRVIDLNFTKKVVVKLAK